VKRYLNMRLLFDRAKEGKTGMKLPSRENFSKENFITSLIQVTICDSKMPTRRIGYIKQKIRQS